VQVKNTTCWDLHYAFILGATVYTVANTCCLLGLNHPTYIPTTIEHTYVQQSCLFTHKHPDYSPITILLTHPQRPSILMQSNTAYCTYPHPSCVCTRLYPPCLLYIPTTIMQTYSPPLPSYIQYLPSITLRNCLTYPLYLHTFILRRFTHFSFPFSLTHPAKQTHYAYCAQLPAFIRTHP
jgi:hypothetical protein